MLTQGKDEDTFAGQSMSSCTSSASQIYERHVRWLATARVGWWLAYLRLRRDELASGD